MSVQTDIAEAAQWLSENAPEWRLRQSVATLKPSQFVDGPTKREVEVELWFDGRSSEMTAVGTGPTHLQAVWNALGWNS